MLVLSRKRNEEIVCTIPDGIPPGSQIVITVVEIRNDKVRVGINADKDISIHRREVQDAIGAHS